MDYQTLFYVGIVCNALTFVFLKNKLNISSKSNLYVPPAGVRVLGIRMSGAKYGYNGNAYVILEDGSEAMVMKGNNYESQRK